MSEPYRTPDSMDTFAATTRTSPLSPRRRSRCTWRTRTRTDTRTSSASTRREWSSSKLLSLSLSLSLARSLALSLSLALSRSLSLALARSRSLSLSLSLSPSHRTSQERWLHQCQLGQAEASAEPYHSRTGIPSLSLWVYRNPRVFQAPLEHTIFDFWRMVLENDVVTVLMLCSFIENGTVTVVCSW